MSPHFQSGIILENPDQPAPETYLLYFLTPALALRGTSEMSLKQPQGREEPGIFREALLGSCPWQHQPEPLYSILLVFQLYLQATDQRQ